MSSSQQRAVCPTVLWDGRTSDGLPIGDAEDVLELLWLLVTAVLAWVRRLAPAPELRHA